MVYARTVADTDLTLIVSGKLWRNSMIMMDEETGSLWSHVTGKCLEGEHAGTVLEVVPSVQTTWAEWRDDHPDTRVLAKSEAITSSRYQSYYDDPERTGLFRAQWLMERLPGKTLVHGVTVGPHALAVTDERMDAGRPVEGELGGVAVTLRLDPDGGVRAVRNDTGEELPVRTAYWFAWSGFFANTAVID